MSHRRKVVSGLSFSKSRRNSFVLTCIRKNYERNKQLKEGYTEMAEINLSIAQMCFSADNDVMRQCEEKLTECE